MIMESYWVPVIGNRNVAENQSNFHSENFRPSQPLVGLFYEDWYSPTRENIPLSHNFVQINGDKNAQRFPARQSIDYLSSPIDRQSSSTPNLTIIIITSLLIGASLILAALLLRPKLENHEMCGITTGGQEECYFDCVVTSCAADGATGSSPIVLDPSCLQDCFSKEPEKSCLDPLLTHVQENSICSASTQNMLLTSTCMDTLFGLQTLIRDSIIELVVETCDLATSLVFLAAFQSFFSRRRKRSFSSENNATKSNVNTAQTRLAPVQFIVQQASIPLPIPIPQLNTRTTLPYENTRNRYPWLCSLRSKGTSPAHRCAVNLLSIPPKPTVVVGAAHCTYLCKDGATEVPACCCSDGPGDCSETRGECGDDPKVVEMTGEDSSIICGEWNTSEAEKDATGERYNVQLPITKIVRHPSFDPTKGPINGYDIVVFKVDDAEIKNNAADSLELWPACLPTQTSNSQPTGIHTGWSEPPSLAFIQNKVPGFESIYEDFYKQWHYKMDIFGTCEDPSTSALCGGALTFPSNSSYPPGTVCAKDFTRQSCFSTGESGSPLMVQHYLDPGRFYINGILSFVKGCNVFQFGPINTAQTNWFLNQQSENPTAYTKLSCFLPWIAEQYFMIYEGSDDQACTTGSGDPQDGESSCRNTISSGFEENEDLEIECKFPFYYKGVKYDECVLFDEDGFVYPVFRCPIRDITTKIEGINSFEEFTTLGGGICLTDSTDSRSTLDPALTCNNDDKRQPFSQCKNNCPGGKNSIYNPSNFISCLLVQAFGIIGGGAVLGGVSALAGLGSLATMAGVGTVGTVGVGVTMMMAQSMCSAPFYCNTTSGKCCLVVFSLSGIVCPTDC